MKQEYHILGMMSGTSLDGVDLAYCHFREENRQWQHEILHAETIKYPEELRDRLFRAIEMPAMEYHHLDYDLGHFFAREVNRFIHHYKIQPDYIASHGHTVFHQPEAGFTAQIGKGAAIAAGTGVPTICDFRSTDIALGGQGAPLVPVGDEWLFHNYDTCLNLGGFSNISYAEKGKRVAFDISPCNLPLNLLARQTGKEYDKEGAIARSGILNEELFQQLNALDFYAREAPKSLGYEWLRCDFLPKIEKAPILLTDKLNTVVEHIAHQISRTINGLPGKSVLVTGGGAKNSFLMERIEELADKKLEIPEELIVDYKEALIFAFLGLLRVKEENNCRASVTGARKDSCGGAIYYS